MAPESAGNSPKAAETPANSPKAGESARNGVETAPKRGKGVKTTAISADKAPDTSDPRPPARRPLGRQSKLTDEVQRKIVEIVKIGGYLESAAMAAGIATGTLHRWMAEGDPDGNLPQHFKQREFREAVTRGRAEFEAIALAQIQKAATTGDWKASAWVLERTRPKEYGRRIQQEVSGPDGGPVTTQDASVAELLKLVGEGPGLDAK